MRGRISSIARNFGPQGHFASVSVVQGAGTAVDQAFFVDTRKEQTYEVQAIRIRASTLSSASETVTVRKVPSGTAISSGTALHTAVNVSSAGLTVNTDEDVTLSTTAGALYLGQGDTLALDFSGAPTNLVACITVELVPASK